MDFLEDPTLRERAMSIASIITNTMEGRERAIIFILKKQSTSPINNYPE